jgi:hypothetical protein
MANRATGQAVSKGKNEKQSRRLPEKENIGSARWKSAATT